MRVVFTREGPMASSCLATRANGTQARVASLRNRDPLPHEVVHLVVERERRWARGLWGSVAGGYRVKGSTEVAIKDRRRQRSRPRLLSADHKADLGTSEATVIALTAAWMAGHQAADETERRIHTELDRLAAHWAALPEGGTLTLDWPDTLLPRR